MGDPGEAAKVSSRGGLAPGAPDARDPAELPIGPAPEPARAQLALVWDGQRPAGIAAEPPEPKRRHYRGARGDWRRATEYLAGRGKLPLENLHDLARLPAKDFIARMVKMTGMSREAAYREWRSLNEAILPFTAAKLALLEAPEGAGSVALGAAAAHYLAAAAFTSRSTPSHNRMVGDGQSTVIDQRVTDGLPSILPLTVLPPKGAD